MRTELGKSGDKEDRVFIHVPGKGNPMSIRKLKPQERKRKQSNVRRSTSENKKEKVFIKIIIT